MFESISLDITAYLGFVNVKVWVKDGTLHYSRNVMTSPDENCNDAVSNMSVEEFSKRLNNIGVADWKKHYEPIGVVFMDGVSWEVMYEDSDYKRHKYTGDNEYPVSWKKFLKLLKKAVGDFETYED